MSIPCAIEMLGSEFRETRRRLRMTQAEIAHAIGRHPNTVAKWERDEQRIPKWVELVLPTLRALEKPEWNDHE